LSLPREVPKEDLKWTKDNLECIRVADTIRIIIIRIIITRIILITIITTIITRTIRTIHTAINTADMADIKIILKSPGFGTLFLFKKYRVTYAASFSKSL
jgi:hypothetical protein